MIHLALQIPLSGLRCLLLCLAVFSSHLCEQPARKPVVNDLSSCHAWLNDQWDCSPCHTECQTEGTSSILPDRCHHSPGAGVAGPSEAAVPMQWRQEAKERCLSALVWIIHFMPHKCGLEERRTQSVAPCGSKQKGDQGFDLKRSTAHQVQPRGLQIQAAFVLELPREARQCSTVLHHAAGRCVFSRPKAATWSKKEGERFVCLLGCSAGGVPVALYSKTLGWTLPLPRGTFTVFKCFRGKIRFANLIWH